ncbi:hypothetical protein [Hymenobacter koreensis]|uniref:Uncharacterized protein n=1 Tax=Hymenobacter koreensis TaxID=1084523 RepID=A0ABP8JGY6_9BACT
MAVISEEVKRQCAANPTQPVPVVVTTAHPLQDAALTNLLQPIQGLDGIYKGLLTRQQLQSLENNPAVASIEADLEVKALDG